jgi:L-ascorbate metabolism protein UlaG (beta-lactamase superfamily)
MSDSLAGRRLRTAIETGVPEEGVAIWWLGQAGFVVRGASVTVVVDPFLTDFGSFGRLYEPPLEPDDLDFVDVLLGTHDHADHIDPVGFPAILRASRHAVAVVPEAVRSDIGRLEGIDPARLRGARADNAFELAGIRIDPLAAVHAPHPDDGYGFHRTEAGDHPFLGYVIELAGVRIAHTGDTLVYPELAERLRAAELDVLIAPINGISWFRERRGLAGNMNVFELAELAEQTNARITVPIHWDLFADNTEDPEHFVRYAAARHPQVNVAVPRIGTPLVVSSSLDG